MTTVINEAGREIDWDAAVQLMYCDWVTMDDMVAAGPKGETDDEMRQRVFLEYVKYHRETFGEEFEPNKANPVW